MKIFIHRVRNITAGEISRDNSNAMTITLKSDDCDLVLQTFDLPLHVAEAVRNLLGDDGVQPAKSEEQIRADERAKVIAEISAPIAAE
jgi:hypothetical protein